MKLPIPAAPCASRPPRAGRTALAAAAVAAAAVLSAANAGLAQTTTWSAPTNHGEFGDAANWTAGVPAAGLTALFDPGTSANSASVVVRAGASFDRFTFRDGFNPTNTALFGNDAAADTVLTLGAGLPASPTLIDVQATSGTITFQPKNPQAQAAPANLSLALAQSGVVNVAAGGRLVITSLISGTTSTALTKTGAGTLVLGFTNNTYQGLTISGGVVEAIGTSYNALGVAAGALTLDGGTLRHNTSSTATTTRGLTITANNGTIDAATNTAIGGPATGAGRLTKTGNATLTLTGTGSYQGGLTVLAGAFSASSAGQLGALPATTVADYLRLDGGTLRWTGGSVTLGVARGTTIGDAGGTFDITNAAAALRFDGVVTSAATATTAGVTKTGPGTLRLTATNPYRGNTTINQGTLMVGQGASLGSSAVPTTVTINNGGTLAYNTTTVAVPFSTTRTLALDAGAVIEVTTGSTRMAVGGVVADKPGATGSLTKTGTGVLVLSGAGAFVPTYSGPTTVAAGTLLFNTAKGVAAAVTAAAGGTLGGTGSVNMGAGTMSILGTLSPGDSSGAAGAAVVETLDVTGNVSLTDGTAAGTLAIDLDGAAAGRQVDLLAVTGNLDVSNAAVSFQGLSSLPAEGTTRGYVFATYGTLTGTFAAASIPAGASIDYAYQGGKQIAVVVPEPGAALGLLAAGGLALSRRQGYRRHA